MSKTEPYAQSAVEMMKLAKEIIDDFFEIPVKITEDLVEDLTEGLGQLIQEYAEFVASCGTGHLLCLFLQSSHKLDFVHFRTIVLITGNAKNL